MTIYDEIREARDGATEGPWIKDLGCLKGAGRSRALAAYREAGE